MHLGIGYVRGNDNTVSVAWSGIGLPSVKCLLSFGHMKNNRTPQPSFIISTGWMSATFSGSPQYGQINLNS